MFISQKSSNHYILSHASVHSSWISQISIHTNHMWQNIGIYATFWPLLFMIGTHTFFFSSYKLFHGHVIPAVTWLFRWHMPSYQSSYAKVYCTLWHWGCQIQDVVVASLVKLCHQPWQLKSSLIFSYIPSISDHRCTVFNITGVDKSCYIALETRSALNTEIPSAA